MTANAKLAGLTKGINARLLCDVETYDLEPGIVLIQWVYENDSEEAETTRAAVAWDDKASDEGAGACFVDSQELSTWLSLRWPVTEGPGQGWFRDGNFSGATV